MLDQESLELEEACESGEAPTGAAMEVGRILRCDASGRVLVQCGSSGVKPARVVAHLTSGQIAVAIENGQGALIAYEGGDPDRPIVIGLLQGPEAPADRDRPHEPTEATVDGETVTIEGKKQVVLKCGKASITLTRAGKVLIRGTYVLSRSTGVNRVKGGSIQLN